MNKLLKWRRGDTLYYSNIFGEILEAKVQKVVKYYDGNTGKFDHWGYQITTKLGTCFLTNDFTYTRKDNARRGYRRWRNRTNIG